jgi:hypothetical protein
LDEALESLKKVVTNSLYVYGAGYTCRHGGDLQYDGERPGEGWRAHGYFWRWLYVVVGLKLARVRVWKRRWLSPDRRTTCHSRPPDELGPIWSCSLVVLLTLWTWLDRGRNVRRSKQVVDDLAWHPSEMTKHRWLRRALPHAMKLQQQIRLAALERSEPRPLEYWFSGGLSPPAGLMRRSWKEPVAIEMLWRALSLAFTGSVVVDRGVGIPHFSRPRGPGKVAEAGIG